MSQNQPDNAKSVEGYDARRVDKQQLISRIIFAVAALCLFIFIILSQIFAWGRVNALSDRVVQLRTQLEQRSDKSDCLALYRNDVTTALGVALSANNELWVSVAVRDPNLTPEEQAADNARLGKLLDEANAPLIAASKALAEYDALSPRPAVCPHPGEDGQENG